LSKRKKLLVVCPAPQGTAAGQRLKYEQYLDDWRAAGYDVKVSSFMDMAMWRVVYTKGNMLPKILGTLRGVLRMWLTLLTVPRYDGVYVFMYVIPIGTSLPERILRLLARKVIYDIEDNVMMQQKNELNAIAGVLRSKRKFEYMIRNADHVITSTPFLNDDCLKMNLKRQCTYISSSMDTERFTVVNGYSNKDKPVIGWTGTFSTRPYLDLLRPIFIELKKQRDFKLLVIGNFEYEFPEMDLEVIQWSAESEVADLQKMDIGVYPLPQNDWVMGKSGLKAIQYMTIGIPAVATRIGMTPRLIEHMQNGCLALSDEEWLICLRRLIDEPELRRSIGQAGRKTIEERYSKHVIKNQYLSIINNTL
jgi:L-malate glycosyltransferase